MPARSSCGGDERFRLSCTKVLLDAIEAMDSAARYWIFNTIYHAHAHADAALESREREGMRWRTAASEKRIRTRKIRGANKCSGFNRWDGETGADSG